LGCSAREALRACLPEPLRDQTFSQLLKVRTIYHSGGLTLIRDVGRYGYEAMSYNTAEQPERTVIILLLRMGQFLLYTSLIFIVVLLYKVYIGIW
jgi:hypothetical protein